jgi:hypothetical protein
MKKIHLSAQTNPEIKLIIQDSNLNFLFGSGLSAGYLSTLNTIEKDITNAQSLTDASKREAELKKHYSTYFDDVIEKNLNLIPGSSPTGSEAKKINSVLESYHYFFDGLRELLFLRKSTILNKQANIFTTNIDAFVELALDDIGLEYNDGFIGKFKPVFSSSNFRKIYSQKSQHFNNESEIPSLNLIKLHGSLTWESSTHNRITFSSGLDQVRRIKSVRETKDFIVEFSQLCIVTPSKEKFKDTLLNQNYYDLLRLYSNELEKENSSLFVMGFSFADEHIRELTIRVANSNPTLVIYIFSYNSDSTTEFEKLFSTATIKNNNIILVLPDEKVVEESTVEIPNDFDRINEKFIDTLISQTNRS